MAEVNGEPAGFMIIVPDFHHAFKAIGNGRLLPTGLFKLLAAKSTPPHGPHHDSRRESGVSPARHFRALRARDVSSRQRHSTITGAEASWILEDNDKLEPAARPHRRQRVSPLADLRSADSGDAHGT